MKRIAITQRLVEADGYPENRDALDTRWAEVAGALNWLLLPIPTGSDPKRFLTDLNVDGVIFSGGNDLSSVNPENALSNQRDRFEKQVMEVALANRLPVYGICRGMQFIGQYFGAGITAVAHHAGTRHALHVHRQCALSNLIAAQDTVNSYHQYALASVPDNFDALATAPDGVLEAMAHRALPIFAQMWHPERELPLRQTDLSLLETWMNASLRC